MPVTKDDVDNNPEWNLHVNKLQAAALVLSGQCRASETGQNIKELMDVCRVLDGVCPLKK